MKYRKKPIIIEAFQYDGDLINSKGQYYVPEWAEKAHKKGDIYFKDIGNTPEVMMIKTLEGDMIANIGDYIIQGVNGEIYPCKPDIFEKTYEGVVECQ